jgi:hypothetical protein
MAVTMTDSRLRAAIGKLLDGRVDEVVSELGPVDDEYVVSLMLALLGVSVRAKFGRDAPVSQLAAYAERIKAALAGSAAPPRWVIESVLRAGAGNSLLFSQLRSESPTNLYEGVGLTLGYLLSDLDPDLEMRTRLINEVISVARVAYKR